MEEVELWASDATWALDTSWEVPFVAWLHIVVAFILAFTVAAVERLHVELRRRVRCDGRKRCMSHLDWLSRMVHCWPPTANTAVTGFLLMLVSFRR